MPYSDCDRPGRYKARIIGTGILPSQKTNAVSVSLRLHLTEFLDPEEKIWIPWAEYKQSIFSSNFITKKDGSPNEKIIENLCEVLGWSGKLDDFNNPEIEWPKVSVVIESEEYGGEDILKVKWLNRYASEFSGTYSKISPGDLNEIEGRLGATFRAIAGNVARNSGKKLPAAEVPQPTQENTSQPAANSEECPF